MTPRIDFTPRPHISKYKPSNTGYADGCRCDECGHCHMISQKRWRVTRARANEKPLLVPTWPTCQRLKALKAKGWTWVAISEKTGVNLQVIKMIMNRSKKKTHATKADAIKRLWEHECVSHAAESKTPKWDIEPLRRRIDLRYGSLQASPLGELKAKPPASGKITTFMAEKYTSMCGWTPFDIWGDEYLMEGAA